ncbi:MAG: hypothetical protein CMJ27_11180 [Phycisphaerae bacterium]|nr:hypothetical protein [Phycisphaerae bacterium]OUX00585.1 MAG: hypothetical protein CBD91_06355 [Phycisphaeraceae bacterium TMED231]
MEFKNLMAEGDFKITSVNLGEDHGTLNMRGKLPGFGDVWVDYTLTPGHGDDAHARGMVTADGRALAEDGTMLAGKIAGVWRRDGGDLRMITLDDVSNGDQVIVHVEADLRADTAHLKVYKID